MPPRRATPFFACPNPSSLQLNDAAPPCSLSIYFMRPPHFVLMGVLLTNGLLFGQSTTKLHNRITNNLQLQVMFFISARFLVIVSITRRFCVMATITHKKTTHSPFLFQRCLKQSVTIYSQREKKNISHNYRKSKNPGEKTQ